MSDLDCRGVAQAALVAGTITLQYRTSIIILSSVRAATSWFLPLLIRAVYETHAFSTVREFEIYHMIDVDAVEAYRTEYDDPGYSIFGRVRVIGALHVYMPILSCILSCLFRLIGVLAWRSTPSDTEADSRATTYDLDRGGSARLRR